MSPHSKSPISLWDGLDSSIFHWKTKMEWTQHTKEEMGGWCLFSAQVVVIRLILFSTLFPIVLFWLCMWTMQVSAIKSKKLDEQLIAPVQTSLSIQKNNTKNTGSTTSTLHALGRLEVVKKISSPMLDHLGETKSVSIGCKWSHNGWLSQNISFSNWYWVQPTRSKLISLIGFQISHTSPSWRW